MGKQGRAKGSKQKITQQEFIEEYKVFSGNTLDFHKHLCKKFGISKKGAASTYTRVKTYKAKGLLELEQGVSVHEGTILTGISRYHKLEDGGVWIKADVEKEQQLNAFREAVGIIIEDVKPIDAVTAPTISEDLLTTFYPIPDLHVGALIHGDDAHHGQNWDTKIVAEWVKESMNYLVATAPASRYAVITDLGDLMHAVDDSKQTKSGHHLDVDGRHSTTVKATFDIMLNIIDQALLKHEIVYFYSVPGNHNDQVPIYLKAFLAAWYKNEPRVVIGYQDRELTQQYHTFGRNILGFAHGHQLRPTGAAETLVADNAATFSDSEYRYFHFGHLHHNEIKEGKLCTTEVHKNLIPQDFWAQSIGYRGSIGYAKAITYHTEYGELSRAVFNIKMVDA